MKGEMRVKKAGAWLLCAAWMVVIYVMSAMPGDTSGAQSGMIVDLLLAAVRLLFGVDAAAAVSVELLSLLVRKAAHMTEYAVLACLYLRALRMHGIRHPQLLAIALCALYAASDELHQAFVPGRGPSPVDVAIDTAGACIGLTCLRIARRITKRKATT